VRIPGSKREYSEGLAEQESAEGVAEEAQAPRAVEAEDVLVSGGGGAGGLRRDRDPGERERCCRGWAAAEGETGTRNPANPPSAGTEEKGKE